MLRDRAIRHVRHMIVIIVHKIGLLTYLNYCVAFSSTMLVNII